ncbi:MAG: endonuclease [Bacilli bacterium]|nr:endonuclease [Bacilli bacterium]
MKTRLFYKLFLVSAALVLSSCNVASSSSISLTSNEESSSVTTSDESSEESSSVESSSSSISVSTSEDPNAYKWNISLSLYGEAFQERLGELINATRSKTSSRSASLSVGAKAAAYPNANSSTFIPFYHEATSANATTQSACNREHTWPDSRGGGDIENDPVVLRPTLTKDNSSRGNNFYGIASAKEWDPASCGYEGARGESARVILYAVTCYRKTKNLNLSNNPNDSTSARTMGTLKTLLEWNRTYAPTEFEKTVNERYDAMGFARNAFVDNPEFADYIYDANGYRTSPYGNGGGGGDVTVTRTYYAKQTDLTTIGGNSYLIGSSDPQSGLYSTMQSEISAEERPWYLSALVGTYQNSRYYSSSKPDSFLFTKLDNGNYTISSGNNYLYGYTCTKDKAYYSIGLGKSESEVKSTQSSATFNSISNEWTLIDKGNGDCQLKSGNVYLEYFKGTWCGYNYEPKVSLSLFTPTAQTETVS